MFGPSAGFDLAQGESTFAASFKTDGSFAWNDNNTQTPLAANSNTCTLAPCANSSATATQGLYQLVQKQDSQLAEKEARIAALENAQAVQAQELVAELTAREALEARLAALEQVLQEPSRP